MSQFSAEKSLKAAIVGSLLIPVSLIAAPSLTIYNGNYAVVRDQLSLDLKKGTNQVQYNDITQQVEADSVVVRPTSSKLNLTVLEQNYLSRPINESLLLQHFEGQTIDFEVNRNQETKIVPGKILRSGLGSGYNNTPIIEINGKTRFGLPGTPLFPPLKDDALLKPTLDWRINASKSGKADIELAYLTGGLSWKSDYNVVTNENNEKVDITGWVTFNNYSGKDFNNAKVKLMAGDINKIQPKARRSDMMMRAAIMEEAAPSVTEKAFDEYHLYSIAHPVDMKDGESKQIGFIDAKNVKSKTRYVYDGAQVSPYHRAQMERLRTDPNFGNQSNTDIKILREFKNSKDNQLGIALPGGRVRFYQQDDDGQLEFIGENTIDHNPKNSTISIYTGNAFDIKGERKRTDFNTNNRENWVKETFEITLRNEKKAPVTVTVVEHLYRWTNWAIEKKSDAFNKIDSQTIEFEIDLKPEQEKTVSYTVHYSW